MRLDRNIHDDDEVSNNSRSRALHAGRGSAALVWKQAWLALLLLSVPLQCYFAAAAIGRWPLATRIDRIQRVARTKYGIKCYLHFCFPLFFAKDSSILLIINMACIFFLDFNLKKCLTILRFDHRTTMAPSKKNRTTVSAPGCSDVRNLNFAEEKEVCRWR